MTKENQKAKPSRDVVVAVDNEFTVNLLEQLQFIEPKRLLEVRAFFTQAFVHHTNHPLFDTEKYRTEWADNIDYIDNLCYCVENYSEEDLNKSINQSVEILKNTKEVRNV